MRAGRCVGEETKVRREHVFFEAGGGVAKLAPLGPTPTRAGWELPWCQSCGAVGWRSRSGGAGYLAGVCGQ